ERQTPDRLEREGGVDVLGGGLLGPLLVLPAVPNLLFQALPRVDLLRLPAAGWPRGPLSLPRGQAPLALHPGAHGPHDRLGEVATEVEIAVGGQGGPAHDVQGVIDERGRVINAAIVAPTAEPAGQEAPGLVARLEVVEADLAAGDD